ncbi:hypothetical protein U0035_11910 [Niabella yanshanensis]|uniref:T9SS C-terminal target domain-containing protein n=1 Tax=Niabella yanshanensis TaxID=577386 RepID=A0ABZ0W2W7_9BACT|nr:hypothetical protein [Niabella yanshanensis]WQD36370.1 hypothetical protein U0035_11910 [Niabella yanshanensis]
MKTSKSIIAAFLLPLSVWLTACDKDDDPLPEPEESGNTIVSGNISTNTTWTKNKVYELDGRVTVLSGATLTIEPGTIIKGQAGAGASSTALLIARGAKIMAEGTASAPIIFTSVADEIEPADVAAGNFASPNLAPTVNGLWGGVLILGKAPISASAEAVQIEGIPTSDQNGLYGGTVAADNSGVLKYISIRHGGTEIGAGNEINGLTLGGVGSGTVIENIEVVGNQDDGIEWFGGTVNVKNIMVWNAGDDGLDTDQAWTGTVDNFAVITPGGHCFELDGPEGPANTNPHTIKNGYVNAENAGDLINTDANTYVNLQNIFITGIKAGQVVRHNAPGTGVVTYTGINLDIPSGVVTDYIKNNAGAAVAVAGIVKGTANTFNAAPLSWTWASKAGALN